MIPSTFWPFSIIFQMNRCEFNFRKTQFFVSKYRKCVDTKCQPAWQLHSEKLQMTDGRAVFVSSLRISLPRIMVTFGRQFRVWLQFLFSSLVWKIFLLFTLDVSFLFLSFWYIFLKVKINSLFSRLFKCNLSLILSHLFRFFRLFLGILCQSILHSMFDSTFFVHGQQISARPEICLCGNLWIFKCAVNGRQYF